MTGPGTSAATGSIAALLGAAILEVVGPGAITAAFFGALGGATRWLAARYIGDAGKWYKGLLAVPLGAVFALGAISIAAPFIVVYLSGESESWMRDALSLPEARRGIAYFLGLFASEVLDRISRGVEGKDNA